MHIEFQKLYTIIQFKQKKLILIYYGYTNRNVTLYWSK